MKAEKTVIMAAMAAGLAASFVLGMKAVSRGTPYTAEVAEVIEAPNFGNEAGVNLNAASREELMTVKGIGETLSERIIEAREELGGFRSVHDLLYVNGIGAKSFSAMRDSVKIGDR